MHNSINILHLEDDMADAELVQAAIESVGMDCRIDVVQDRDQFNEALHRGGYDVILADYRLPGYDGLSALRLAREVRPDLPFIFVSGTMGEDPAIEVLTEGANDYVLKQRLSRLWPAIKRALREAENWRERKRIENVLRESEERFRTLAEKSLVGVYIIQDSLFRYVNPAFAKIFRHTSDEIIDRLGPVDFLTADDRERVLESIRRRTIGDMESDHLEFQIRRKDGVVRTVEVFGSHAIHQGRPAVLGTIIDVTERRKSEERLFQANQRWGRTFDAVPDLITILDNKFRIVRANKAMADRLGVTPDECIGQICYKAVHGSAAPPAFCPHAQLLLDCREHMAEVREERLGGSFLVSTSPLIDSQGQMIGCVHVARDITELKHAQEELERINKENRLILESAGEGIFGLDSDGRVTFMNPVASAMLGYDPGELIGKRCHELIHSRRANGIPLPEESCPICTTGKEGAVHSINKDVFWRRDGKSFPVEYTSTPIIQNDMPTGVVVTFRDVTEREELEKRLRQSQKLEAIGTLAGGIAHDFNNILGIILGCTELTLMEMKKESRQWENVNQVHKAAERAKALVRQVLTFSRHSDQERKPTRVDLVVKEALRFLRSSLPSTIDFRNRIEENMGEVMADPTQIYQVIMNLCVNAAHSMREKGGILEVEVTNVEMNPEMALKNHLLNAGTYCRLIVRDTGHGIEPAHITRVFDPYFTTKEPEEGTGLGLSVAHGIVKSHGGAITVESEPGKGTAFEVLLPQMIERVESEIPLESDVSLGKGERVLAVDDEESLAELLRHLIKSLGYNVSAWSNSVEALRAFAVNPDAYDVIVTDLTMPDMTGLDLAKSIRKIRPQVPIILCTGFSELIDERKAKEQGISDLLLKPITRRRMAEAIRKALETPNRQGESRRSF